VLQSAVVEPFDVSDDARFLAVCSIVNTQS
jgi:hypothetical protein